jgi:hypothetical protein
MLHFVHDDFTDNIDDRAGDEVADAMAQQNTMNTLRIDFDMHAFEANVYLVRSLVNQAALAWRLPDDTRRTAQLILTELVTNAVRLYPGARLKVWVANPDQGTVLEMGVWDPDPAKGPHLAADGLMEETGRGLLMVHELCARQWGWYVSETTGGKVVWARLAFQRGTGHSRR